MTPFISGFSRAVTLWRYTFYSSLIKISLRNAGSWLGLVWEPLSTLLVSLILASVWIKVLGIQVRLVDYFAYVYCGMVVWGLLASSVSNLCATFVKNAKSLTSRTLPIFSYVFEDILLSLIPFAMSLPIILLIVLISGYELTFFGLAVFVTGCILVVLTALGFAMSIGLSAFFIGDIRQLITAIMRLSFLVTPVIWKPERLGDSEWILLFNPFYGYLHILRNGITGQNLDPVYVTQAVLITFTLLAIGATAYSLSYRKIQQRALLL